MTTIDPAPKLKASIWRIVNGLGMWLSMVAAVGGIIAIAEFFSETKISYNQYDFARFVDYRLWFGQLLGACLLRGIYALVDKIQESDSSIFVGRVIDDIYSALVSFGWLFILSVPVCMVTGRGPQALGNYILGVFNIILVYYLAAERDANELDHRARDKSDEDHDGKMGQS